MKNIFIYPLLYLIIINMGLAQMQREDILAKLTANRIWQNSYSMKVVLQTEITGQDNTYRKEESIIHKEGQKTEWLINSGLYTQDNALREQGSFKRFRIMTPQYDYDVQQQSISAGCYGTFGNYVPKEQSDWLKNEAFGGFLDGIMPGLGSSADIVEELGKYNVKINEDELLCGTSCIQLEMNAPYGKVKVWLDPVKNYSLLKYSLEKTSQDLWTDKPLAETIMNEWSVVVEDIEVKKIGDHFIPIKGTYTRKTIFKDGKEKIIRSATQRDQIDVNPDFEAMGAFKLSIPNGSILFNREVRNIPYEWINGELVPYIEDMALDSLDSIAAELNVSYIKPTNKDPDNTSSCAEAVQKIESQTETAVTSSRPTSSSPAVAARNHHYMWLIGVTAIVAMTGGLLAMRWR
ncbi:MAG: hypothetical protein LLF76_04070 [Planctomycetaceae bacterium]|nr:hypothetical protein [Planctomycetaceae bacterium]